MRKKSLFHILILILPTKFLRASSACHRAPTGPSHTRGRVEVSEPLGTQCSWHSDSYSVRGNAKFVSPIYASSLAKPAAFSRTAERFSLAHLEAKPSVAS